MTTPEDILDALNIERMVPQETNDISVSDTERAVLTLLSEPRDQDTLVRVLEKPAEETLMLLVRMQMRGLVREENGVFFRV